MATHTIRVVLGFTWSVLFNASESRIFFGTSFSNKVPIPIQLFVSSGDKNENSVHLAREQARARLRKGTRNLERKKICVSKDPFYDKSAFYAIAAPYTITCYFRTSKHPRSPAPPRV